jgi:hypothetical protein
VVYSIPVSHHTAGEPDVNFLKPLSFAKGFVAGARAKFSGVISEAKSMRPTAGKSMKRENNLSQQETENSSYQISNRWS